MCTTTSSTDTRSELDPLIGKVARDIARDLLGKVMDKVGPNYQLRPLTGGREWEAGPDTLEIVVPERCDFCDRIKAERSKAHKTGRHATVHGFTLALGRHMRVMHP
ncbi:hypothetical protein J1792_02735 [Streptomyces triculaminicus]|uniref:Uncharacterized protein n=2 Tax=Streptomyces TaxID=1883 RepID=A0A939FJI3_9ACTN|nr:MULTISPECIES: hypothetical protein [Streptomyces]MBO0651753.1 hypothetical protein [Streptomyces triculaminicus]QSY47317.1 hypothetical protein J3S04_18335 [Streptomyces griseocarneus]